MKNRRAAFEAEWLKIRRARMVWGSFVVFALAPAMGAVFMVIIRSPDAMQNATAMSTKARAMDLSASWSSYMGILMQAVGVGGLLIFGFVISWLFAREYSEKTALDLLALPTSRSHQLEAKFLIYLIWGALLALSNLAIGFLFGNLLQLDGAAEFGWGSFLMDYAGTTLLTLLLGTPLAFFSLWGKGYMVPLSFVAISLVLAQVIAATGYGTYFPWSLPGLYSGAGGAYKNLLDVNSFVLLVMVSAAGYVITLVYWNRSDQT